ncbi:hypothetical protein WJX81_008107 [Elliptochloris bilobata]|uniref:Uncharacterized protein n=1 Tax=Elliptochloris bilobata TaxID=381761 RepID=A0AAW1SD75_9CHLO
MDLVLVPPADTVAPPIVPVTGPVLVVAGRTVVEEDAQAPDTDFAPNLVNTVCFLVQFLVMLVTFAVNYQGHPFNAALRENRAMVSTLKYGGIGFVVLVLDLVPGANSAMSLVAIPRPLARQMLGAAAVDLALTWAWENALRAAFPAPRPPAKGYQAFSRELAALERDAKQAAGRLKAE